MKNCANVSRFHLSWQRDEERRLILVAYDASNNEELVFALIDYASYLSETVELDGKTVVNEVQYVRRFLEYLLSFYSSGGEVTEKVFRAFRGDELKRVKQSRNRSQSDNAAKRTVNAKMRRVYLFLEWVRETQVCSICLGAHGFKVPLPLGDPETTHSDGHGGKILVSDQDRFPLLYRGVGEGSKHRTKYVASTKNKGDLVDLFLETQSPTLAHRNILILELADQVGMRRGSINSLRTDQFSREGIEKAEGDWAVIPPAQKFGYEKRYLVPFRLAFRICDYIEQVRRQLLLERGWSEARTENRLFVSLRDGKPLSDRTLSQIFGRGLKDVGVDEHGAGVHSFRRKFATDNIVQETERRRRLNLDTSVASVAAAVSLKMGHSNPASLAPYVSRSQALLSDSAQSNTARDLAQARDEILRLKLEMAKRDEAEMSGGRRQHRHSSRKKRRSG